MYDFIKGRLVEKNTGVAVVETFGVGYAIMIPASTYEALPDEGSETQIFTHLSIREDAHKLYGFFTRGERELFRRLIDVNMIGPKVALNVLSNISVANLIGAVNSGDASRLKSLPGIGPKTAQRLVLELKGKLDHSIPVGSGGGGIASSARPAGIHLERDAKKEVYEAMISLGYTDKQILRAIDRVETTIAATASLEEWIRAALQVI